MRSLSPTPLVLPFALLWIVAGGVDGARMARAADDEMLAVAERARPSVARIIWRDERFSEVTMSRNAFVVRSDGLLLMAGPPPSRRGTLTARFADRSESRARLVAWDAKTALSLLQVSRTDLKPLALRVEPAVKARKPGAHPAGDPEKADADQPNPGAAGAPRAAASKGETRPQALRETEPAWPGLPPLGLPVVMVNGEGAVALGPVRAHGRHGTVTDPDTRRKVRTTGLFELALAALDDDVGSPLLDADGKVAGLLVGRRAAIAPRRAARAARDALRLRPEPVEAVALPARVAALVWPLLERHHRIPRASLGITTVPADAALAGHLRLEGGGHVIRSLVPSGVAERHGLKVHDVIVSVEGRAMGRGSSLHDALLPFRPGASVRIEVIRAGRRESVSVRTGER